MLGALLPGGRRGSAARHLQPPHRTQALRERDRGRGLLPEARAEEAPGLGAYRRAALSLGSHRLRARRDRLRTAGVDDESWQHRPEAQKPLLRIFLIAISSFESITGSNSFIFFFIYFPSYLYLLNSYVYCNNLK